MQTRSDLAAAEALTSLRNTDEEEQNAGAVSQDEQGQHARAAELADAFRVPAPPVPLWVQGAAQLPLCSATV